MNTNLKNRLALLAKGPQSKKDKLDLDKELLSARFLSEIQICLEDKNISRKEFAKKMGVSASFVSQLFTADKVVSMEFLAKAQQVLDLKFYVSVVDIVDIENFASEMTTKIMEEMIRLEEKYNKEQKQEDEDGTWVYYAKEKPDYNKIDKDIFEQPLLSVA